MKVLFAVNDENISASIVKKYSKEYKEILTYKNVYYFNAILKELQRDKSYDRVIISEDLEEFTSSSYEQKDKFIFDKLDNISDEAVSDEGKDIPIILICSERRTKGEEILVKLFGISIYNAVIGEDRSIDEVCKLINKPRSKKDAKLYYRIDSEKVTYQKGKENDVREEEIQNILLHFKKLGKNENRYVESFNNIVSQYNEEQLKVIIAVLPNSVKEVLKYNSPEYQKLANIDINTKNEKGKRNLNSKATTVQSTGKLLKTDANPRMVKPVIMPGSLEKEIYKKVTPKKQLNINLDDYDENEDIDEVIPKTSGKRGRPRKNPLPDETTLVKKTPGKRGRPRKNPLPEEIEIEPEEDVTENIEDDEFELPGFENTQDTQNDNTQVLPGFDLNDENEENEKDEENDYFEEPKEEVQNIESPFIQRFQDEDNNDLLNQNDDDDFDDNFDSLLAGEKKVVAFVGTGKNGTSFIVNNIAQILSEMKINTAIFDATKNRNAYYIYTKNDEDLRKTAIDSIGSLIDGNPKGVSVNSYLTVYSGIPNQYDEIKQTHPILENLVLKHSVVLIDCDFDTPIDYFDKIQELYLVQSMDVLTIQPLTEFLRDLKAKNVLDENKIRIILNKILKVRGVTPKGIIGGMSKYNDPEMSFMTTLFNPEIIKDATLIPFDEDVYARYLEGLIECEIKLNNYPKDFKQRLYELVKVVYPLLSSNSSNKKNKKDKKQQYVSSFSSDMNNTLNDMRKRY